jgi:hypothetical protein
MRRSLLLAAALAIPLSGALIGLTSNVAGAGVKITCTNITGNDASTITVSGCTGGNTGGKSKPISATALAAGGTVTWNSGSTTHFNKPVLATAKATHCPGYVKPAKGQPQPAFPTLEKFSGVVSADHGDTGLKVPGKFKGEVCVSKTGAITAAKELKIS